MTTSSVLMKEVRSHLGEGGSTFQRWAGIGRGPFCNAFVSYCLAKTGNGDLYCEGRKEINCPHSMNWCIDHLAGIPIYLAMEGDVTYMDWQPNGLPDHVGYVEERISADKYHTIEGNTSGGIVARKVRTDDQEQLTFRLHYTPTTFSSSKKLDVDGLCGYNTIAMLQKALKIEVDGILGQGTVKALQRLCGASADGLWGKSTSKKLQKYLKVTADGEFGPASVKALQKWINTITKSSPSKKVVTKTWQDKANEWARDIAKQKYHYVRWGGNEKSHTCPICKGRKYNSFYGWNCIGFAYACWHHGGKLGTKCNCGVITNEVADRLLKVTQTAANKMASDRIGKPVTVIRNGGKSIPLSMLKAGDICMLYRGSTYYHTIYYMGNGKYAESNTAGGIGSAKNIRADISMSSTCKANLKCAIRYNGKRGRENDRQRDYGHSGFYRCASGGVETHSQPQHEHYGTESQH